MNVLRFPYGILQIKTVLFAGLKFFLLVHKFLSLLLNEFLQSEIMQKSRSVQNITSILAFTDE